MRKLFVVLMGLILIAGNANAASYARPLPAYNRTIVIRDSGPKIDPAAYIFGGIIAGIIIYAIIDVNDAPSTTGDAGYDAYLQNRQFMH